MSRKQRVYKRRSVADNKYGDRMLGKFLNCLMYDGKKSVAEGIVYESFDLIKQRHNVEGLDVFTTGIGNVKPLLEVRSRRVGGANYQIPTEVRPERQEGLAIRWIINSARGRSERTMSARLAAELYDAFSMRGGAIKKREDTHKMAEANRAFAHYRW